MQKFKFMKKILIFVCVSIFTLGFSQEDKPVTTTTTTTTVSISSPKESKRSETFSKKNEFRIDPTYLIFAGALSISYEALLSSESGLGATLILSSGKEINTTFSLTPYYRFYFGKKPAAGFFFEGFASVNTFKYDKVTYNYNNNGYYNNIYSTVENKSSTDFAIGIGLGGKWITNNGIIFELSGGIGRNLLNDYSTNNSSGLSTSEKIVGRGGISIGYRF